MIDLYMNGMVLYRQDNAITERILKYFNARISHVLCGPTMLANLHSLMGWNVDRVTPPGIQWEDYIASVIWNMQRDDNDFPPSNPNYFPDAMLRVFNKRTTKIEWTQPTVEIIRGRLQSGLGVGVCWYRDGYGYHWITIRGIEGDKFKIIDSAPDLAGNKMLYDIPIAEIKKFSDRMVVVKRAS